MGTGRALITGGSVGIGAALAEVFAARGHDLILVSRTRIVPRPLIATLSHRAARPTEE